MKIDLNQAHAPIGDGDVARKKRAFRKGGRKPQRQMLHLVEARNGKAGQGRAGDRVPLHPGHQHLVAIASTEGVGDAATREVDIGQHVAGKPARKIVGEARSSHDLLRRHENLGATRRQGRVDADRAEAEVAADGSKTHV